MNCATTIDLKPVAFLPSACIPCIPKTDLNDVLKIYGDAPETVSVSTNTCPCAALKPAASPAGKLGLTKGREYVNRVASITVDGVNNVNFYDNRSELHDLRIDGSRISTTTSNADLTLSAPGTGSVVIDDQLQILTTPSPDDSAVDPAQPTDGLKIYAKSQGVGKTGLYYVNSNNVRDEIISKNRSLLLSMIF